MIYFVDEDVAYAKQFSVPFQLRGFSVETLPNADIALSRLTVANDVELVIVDIMLATDQAEISKFMADVTEGFLKTGLELMKELSVKRSDIFPRKFFALTAASEVGLVDSIKRTCKNLRVPVFSKSDYRRPAALADLLLDPPK